ncbi:MAG: hypothetical protein IPL49_18215 [Saprospirales bacterium]|nr:hypothetical protein [Saprospirales bacterium]
MHTSLYSRNSPRLWKEGKILPEAQWRLCTSPAERETWFNAINNDSEVDNKVRQLIFPETTSAYVWDGGTIQKQLLPGHSAHIGPTSQGRWS